MNWKQPIVPMIAPLVVRGRSALGTLCREVLILAAICAAAGRIQAAEPSRATNEFIFPKSVFVYNDPKGKDPFYPNRPRAGTVPVSTNVTVSTGPNLADFQLRGITGPPERRIALINNLTFVKGEEQEVRAGNARVKIKVQEIRDKSVIVLIEGQAEPKELLLRDTQLPFNE